MMDYYELLEMDTDNADVQLQLYYCCLTGNGKGIDDPYKWLKLSAENGNSEAQKILSDIEKDKINNQVSQINEKVKEYENTDTIDLVELANYDYYAAKELYRRLGNPPVNEHINNLKRICSFEHATVEDFEKLVEVYNAAIALKQYVSWDEMEYACQNAYEMGSKKTDKHYICYFFFNFFCDDVNKENFVSDDNIEKLKNLLVRNIKESDYILLFTYFSIICSDVMDKCPNICPYRVAFFEALNKNPDKGNHRELHNLIDENPIIFRNKVIKAKEVFEKFDKLDVDYNAWLTSYHILSGEYKLSEKFRKQVNESLAQRRQTNLNNQQTNVNNNILSKITSKVNEIIIKIKEFFNNHKILFIIIVIVLYIILCFHRSFF